MAGRGEVEHLATGEDERAVLPFLGIDRRTEIDRRRPAAIGSHLRDIDVGVVFAAHRPWPVGDKVEGLSVGGNRRLGIPVGGVDLADIADVGPLAVVELRLVDIAVAETIVTAAGREVDRLTIGGDRRHTLVELRVDRATEVPRRAEDRVEAAFLGGHPEVVPTDAAGPFGDEVERLAVGRNGRSVLQVLCVYHRPEVSDLKLFEDRVGRSLSLAAWLCPCGYDQQTEQEQCEHG